jgi:hypothetical protein
MSNGAELARMATALEMSGNARVLERFNPKAIFNEVAGGLEFKRLMVLDLRATGLQAGVDRIYELAYLIVDFDAKNGVAFRVSSTFYGTEDPAGLAAESDLATGGLSSKALRGTRFDETRIAADIEKVDVVISHNFGADRQLLEGRFPGFASKWFGCSQQDVPWRELGIASSQLEFLAFKVLSCFYSPVGAQLDVQVLAAVLAKRSKDGTSALSRVLDRVRQTSYRIWVKPSTEAVNRAVKRLGYLVRGSGADACFMGDFDDLGAALADLETVGGLIGQQVTVDAITSKERFTRRVRSRKELTIGQLAPAGS